MTDKPRHDKSNLPSGKLLEQLVCPVTKGPLDYDKANQRLISRQIKKAFPIRDGVPILVLDEAISLDEERSSL